MAWRATSGVGPKADACDRLEAVIAQDVPKASRDQAAVVAALARTVDLDGLEDPIEIIADGHVHVADTAPSWIRLQVSGRDTESAPELARVQVIDGDEAGPVGSADSPDLPGPVGESTDADAPQPTVVDDPPADENAAKSKRGG